MSNPVVPRLAGPTRASSSIDEIREVVVRESPELAAPSQAFVDGGLEVNARPDAALATIRLELGPGFPSEDSVLLRRQAGFHAG